MLPEDSASPGDIPEQASQDALSIERITVGDGRIRCRVKLSAQTQRYTDPVLMATVLAFYPTLAQHACKNDHGPTFASVMDHTSLPHLLEHLVIDVQTAHATDPSAAFVGFTQWLDESAGIACVEVSFTDDLDALQAFTLATRFLNNAML